MPHLVCRLPPALSARGATIGPTHAHNACTWSLSLANLEFSTSTSTTSITIQPGIACISASDTACFIKTQ